MNALLKHAKPMFKLATLFAPPLTYLPLVRSYLALRDQYVALPHGMHSEEVLLGSVPAQKIFYNPKPSKGAILYLHGGGFLLNLGSFSRNFTAQVSYLSGIDSYMIDYSLAPEALFPRALTQVVEAYLGLLSNGYGPQDVVLMGESAGGNLVLAALLYIKENKLPLPAAALTVSAWTDLTLSGNSVETAAQDDYYLVPSLCKMAAETYLKNKEAMESPLVSPLFGDLGGLPPLYMAVGTHEILQDDTLRFAEKAQKQGSKVTLDIAEKMPHAYPIIEPEANETQRTLYKLSAFITQHLHVHTEADLTKTRTTPSMILPSS